MSKIHTRRPVLTKLQRAAIAQEIRSLAESVLGLGNHRLAQDGEINLPRDAFIATDASPLTGESLSRTTIDDLRNEVVALERAAVCAGLPVDRVATIASRLSEVVPGAVDDIREMRAGVDRLEVSLVEAVCEMQTLDLGRRAAIEALRRVGLTDLRMTDCDGEVTITAVAAGSVSAQFAVTPNFVELQVEDPPDRVDALHHRARDLCVKAAQLGDQLNVALSAALADLELTTGPVEVVEPPTRGVRQKPRRPIARPMTTRRIVS